MSSKIKQQEYFLWQSLIPQLRKNIDQCIKQIKQKAIFTSSPQDMEMKINKIKCIFEEDNVFDEEEFLDVFAFFIEEKVNITLLELSDLFSMTFGKDNTFWTQKITHWANMYTFTNSLIIWNVTQFLRNFINYSSSPLERDFIYQWRQKVQAYLSSLEFLVRKIQRLKKTDNSYAVDESYIKYHKEKMLYMTFINKFGIKNNSDDSKMSYHDEFTVTFQNKARAEKKLFNFPHATRTIDDMQNYASKQRFLHKKSRNTLQKYNFTKQNYFPIEQYEDSNEEKQRINKNRQELIQSLSMIGKNSKKSMNQLRDQLMNVHALHRQNLKIQKQKLQLNLREHVLKLNAKKKLIQKQKQKEKQVKQKQNSQLQTKLQMKTQDQIEKQKQTQINQIQEPLYYQVVQQQSIDTPEYRHFPMSHAVFIHNPEDYYSFQGQPIGDRNVPVSNPFVLYPWINYYVNDREEYEDFMAISLDDASLESDDDTTPFDTEDDLQEGGSSKKDDDSYFIDRRAVITPDNVEWEKLAPEDKMKFDQIITEDRIRWIAQFKHQDSSQLLSRFTCIAIYGTELPYMIIGPQNSTKSKRKAVSTKEKEKDQNAQTSNMVKIEVITENVEQDNSTTMKKTFGIGNEQTIYDYSQIRCLSAINGEMLKQLSKEGNDLQIEYNQIVTKAINEDIQI